MLNKSNNEIKNNSKDNSYHQEIKLLKQMMKSIEENSLKEKNYFQRQLIKKDEEINILRYQLDQRVANEKNLLHHIKFGEEKFRRYIFEFEEIKIIFFK